MTLEPAPIGKRWRWRDALEVLAVLLLTALSLWLIIWIVALVVILFGGIGV